MKNDIVITVRDSFPNMGFSCPYCESRFENKEDLSKHIDRIHHGSGLLEGDSRKF